MSLGAAVGVQVDVVEAGTTVTADLVMSGMLP
jgi:hypothetical protein